jgi:hypothetical protein
VLPLILAKGASEGPRLRALVIVQPDTVVGAGCVVSDTRIAGVASICRTTTPRDCERLAGRRNDRVENRPGRASTERRLRRPLVALSGGSRRKAALTSLRRPLVALSGGSRRKAALTKLSAWMDDALGSHLGAY